MQGFLNRTVSIKMLYLVIGSIVVLFCWLFYFYFYQSDFVPSLDCITLNGAYLGYVQDKYRSDPAFDSTIWPNAIEVGGKINSLCYESITGEGLLKKTE